MYCMQHLIFEVNGANCKDQRKCNKQKSLSFWSWILNVFSLWCRRFFLNFPHVLHYQKFHIQRQTLIWTWNLNNNQRRIQHRRPPPPRPPFEIFIQFVLVTFDRITHIYFNWSHHTMFTIYTSFSTLNIKHRYVWREH